MTVKNIIDKLYKTSDISKDECLLLLNEYENESIREYLFNKSREITDRILGNKIYIRGLIEYSNYCKNDCFYCGIRKSNLKAERYRLNKNEILSCCESGYKLGFRTFVMQGGEDGFYTDDFTEEIIKEIREKYPDCAITLSMGEKNYESYKRFIDAGANRYLLRHESINQKHYSKLHPENLTIENRVKCLENLKKIGYQTGCGFMVGSPFQTMENIAEDIMFIKDFKPEMIGIGPFIPHKDTPFADFKAGDYRLCVFILGILRLINNNALIPATTALNSVNPFGRIEGIKAGANVIMPNLSPEEDRNKYNLYNGKLSTGIEGAESLKLLNDELMAHGFEISYERGDYKI